MRAVLIGMNNPLSSDPEHALYPHPPGCTGWRIWQMLMDRRPGVTRGQYLRAFERVNLVDGREWRAAEARARARELRGALRGRVVLVLGAAPRRALELPPLLVHPQELGGVTWRQLPHPSGRCRWYNEPEARATAAALLAELYDMAEIREDA